MDDFWSLDSCTASYLNSKEFVDIVSTIYNIKPMHFTINTAQGKMGIPLFFADRPFLYKKLTSMVYNFYPPLVGYGDDITALHAIIDKAGQLGNNCLIEYKTFKHIDEKVLSEINLRAYIPSVVTDLLLTDNPEDRWSCYKKRHRTNLRALIKNYGKGLIFVEADIGLLKSWFRVLQDLYRGKHHMITQPYRLYMLLIKSGIGKLFVGVDNKSGRLLGGIFILKDQDKWEYSWGATTFEGQEKGLSHLLVDYAIAEAVKNGAKVFSFGSSPVTDKNLRFFKTRWGAEEKNTYYIVNASSPPPINLENSYAFVRSFIPFIPRPVLSILSKVIVKVLS